MLVGEVFAFESTRVLLSTRVGSKAIDVGGYQVLSCVNLELVRFIRLGI